MHEGRLLVMVRRARRDSGCAHVPLFGQSPNILLDFAPPESRRTRLQLVGQIGQTQIQIQWDHVCFDHRISVNCIWGKKQWRSSWQFKPNS